MAPTLNHTQKTCLEPTSAFHIDLYYIINNLILSPMQLLRPEEAQESKLKKFNTKKHRFFFNLFVQFVSSFSSVIRGNSKTV